MSPPGIELSPDFKDCINCPTRILAKKKMTIKLICSKNTVAKNSDFCRKFEEKCMRSNQNNQNHHQS